MKEIQPGVQEVGSFLAAFQVIGMAVGKSLVWRLDHNYISDNARYRLAEPTLDRALERLNETLNEELLRGDQVEIQLDNDEEIAGNLMGQLLVDDSVAPSVACDNILNTCPDRVLPGFEFDVTMSDLYCLRGSTWLNDDVMRAVSVFLRRYSNNATVMIPPPKEQPRKTSAKTDPLLSEKIRAAICAGAAAQHCILLPVNFYGVN
ncbi:hypothetical protein Pcac1_g746 [Phytophthora cactorum]|uniref:Uncharacterized protein n=1 Tax=Phytophthora cactorum TaxID=29920 RepID=A0A329SDC2_9STRA|nr:hypothetical protein Pcac1_g746 [Phytophthora cactorum]KAG2960666.1 hypothetical protein PC118_g22389 [Phytophthora cactorum]KAG3126944.1 hypothetical protein C6341_g25155 [Phytophthora cactorum]RAW34611.1 hypothetical protein PC110_g9065 [Phytophthora cactorum]